MSCEKDSQINKEVQKDDKNRTDENVNPKKVSDEFIRRTKLLQIVNMAMQNKQNQQVMKQDLSC